MSLPAESAEPASLTSVSAGAIFEAPALALKSVAKLQVEGAAVAVQSFALRQQRSPSTSGAAAAFLGYDGDEIGLRRAPRRIRRTMYKRLYEPFSYGSGIASADINQDKWPDLVVAQADYVAVYHNIQGADGQHFYEAQRLIHPLPQSLLQPPQGQSPFVVALADINSDAWPDLVVTFYGGDSVVYMNQTGVFETKGQVLQTPKPVNLTMALGFFDLGRDGDVDIVQGNWSYGTARDFNPAFSQNYLLINQTPRGSLQADFVFRQLSGPAGETLSLLISDLNHDGVEEVVVANDRDVPDVVYLVDHAQQRLVLDKRFDSGLAVSAYNTMSLDSGDVNNDGHLDMFAADMSFGPDEGLHYCQALHGQYAQICAQFMSSKQAIASHDVRHCANLIDDVARDHCFSAMLLSLAKLGANPKLCEAMPLVTKDEWRLCQRLAERIASPPALQRSHFPHSVVRNVLLLSQHHPAANKPALNRFREQAQAQSVAESFWSWNARIVDLDLDGWQDIYVGNGFMFGDDGRHLHANVFYKNMAGEGFANAAPEMNLAEILNSPAYTVFDKDLDGDLDIVINSVLGPLRVYESRAAQIGRSIVQVSVSDGRVLGETTEAGKRVSSVHDAAPVHAPVQLGVKIELHYLTPSGLGSQLREIKLSGGFMSFDPPVATFGLPDQAEVRHIVVHWPDAQVSRLSGDFSVGRHFSVVRGH